MNSCSGDISLNLGNNICALSTQSKYFDISCNESVKANYEHGNLTLKVGQGFKYNISVQLRNNCYGIFKKDYWNDSYNKAQLGLKNARQISDANKKAIEIAWYNYMIEELESIVDNYNDIVDSYKTLKKENDKNNPTATLEINYNYNNVAKTLNYNFEIDNSSRTVSSSYKETLQHTLSNGLKTKNFNSVQVSNIKLIPPRVSLDNNGQVISNGANAVDGGNNFYIDMRTDAGAHAMKIKLNNLGIYGKGTIETSDNACAVIVNNSDIAS